MMRKTWGWSIGSRSRLNLPLILVGFLLTCNCARAQTATGRIIGTATDSQGAAIAGAKITVTNTGTNVNWNTVTNSEGFYQVLELPVGNYSVTAEHEGFSKVVTAPQLTLVQPPYNPPAYLTEARTSYAGSSSHKLLT